MKFAKNVDQISSILHSQLNDIINDEEYSLKGWIRSTSNNNLYSLKTNKTQSFDKIIIGAKKITIIGKTMANIYNLYKSELEESIKSGCEYYILAYDFNENARHILYSDHSYNNHIATNKAFEKLQQEHTNFHYQLLDKWPAYGIISVDYEQKNNNYIQILLYSETMRGFQRPMFKINYGDEWYHPFIEEINHLWTFNKK